LYAFEYFKIFSTLINNISYWKIVGNVVTIKRPVSPGDIVISVLATDIVAWPSLHFANSLHSGSRDLQAGHQGA
jgi:hypothetical protein